MKAKANAVSVSLSLGRRSLERGREGEERWTRRTARRLDKAERVANVSGCVCVWCAEQLQSCSQAKANWQARLKVVIIWAEQLSSERPSLEKKKMSTQLRNYYCEIIIPKLLFQLHQRDTEQSKDSNPSWTAASKQASFIVIITCFPFPAHRHSPPLTATQN